MKQESAIFSYVQELRRTVRNHENWRMKKTLNLIAAENFASPETRYYLSTDFSNRYSARDNFYRGTRYTDEIEALTVKIARKLYHCKFADVRSISGHTCSLIVFMSLLRPDNKVVTCPPKYGGYPGSSELGLGPLLSLRNLYFPYDPSKMNIIPDKTKALLGEEKPEMTVFGSSFIPFPFKIKQSLPPDYSGYKIYDGSHVMGLIAGGKFQDPLREGCSLLMGSTHKSLFGPQGGIILSDDDEIFSKIDEKIFPGIVDNIHWNRVAALAFAMLELLKFGESYATQIVNNSKALARALDELRVPVKSRDYGFTESHQVILDFDEKKSVQIANALEELDIITDIGIRLGTAEVTRRGMKEKEMVEIAEIIADSIGGKSSKAKIRKRVHTLTREFDNLEFTLSRE
jgi:glycine hydroxymethyltransferase